MQSFNTTQWLLDQSKERLDSLKRCQNAQNVRRLEEIRGRIRAEIRNKEKAIAEIDGDDDSDSEFYYRQ